jgi:hypothetical protein
MSDATLTRRDFFRRAGLTGLTAAASPSSFVSDDAKAAAADGTPEQIHLTYGGRHRKQLSSFRGLLPRTETRFHCPLRGNRGQWIASGSAPR